MASLRTAVAKRLMGATDAEQSAHADEAPSSATPKVREAGEGERDGLFFGRDQRAHLCML